jgi:glycosyltransferase involved in cell wall biosynthesis
VLIASRRPQALTRCLESLAGQSTLPGEVIVAWQGDDRATRDAAWAFGRRVALPVRVVHSPAVGIVPAENAALEEAAGEVILLIDDDAVAPPDWIARHAAHYADPAVGAVGGPFDNYDADGSLSPKRAVEPIGVVTWYGKALGNLHDQVPEWRARAPRDVHHLAGGNMSLRRAAFARFEDRLKPYWQFFEMDACLQVRGRGYRVVFDFANVIQHYPTNPVFRAGRDGDPQVKIYNPAFNHAFIMGKHLRGWMRAACLAGMFGVGGTGDPGFLAFWVALLRYGHPLRECAILARTLCARADGWRAGSRATARVAHLPKAMVAAGPPGSALRLDEQGTVA